MEEQKRKCCQNCKYFLEHYIKLDTKFMNIGEGHCINDELPWKLRKNNFASQYSCEKWESNTCKVKQREQRIDCVLKNMLDEIRQIKIIIEDEGRFL